MSNTINMLDALKMFQQGVKQMAVSRSLNRANEMVESIRLDDDLKSQEKLNAARNIAQNLGMNMMKAGADPTQVKQAQQGVVSPFVPSFEPKNEFQAYIGDTSEMSPEDRQSAVEKYLKLKAGIGAGSAAAKTKSQLQIKAPGEIADQITKIKDMFSQKIAKVDSDKFSSIANIRGLTNTNDGKMLSTALSIVKRSILTIAGEKGRFTDRDVMDVSPDKSIRGRVLGWLNELYDGRAPEHFGENIEEITSAMEIVAKRRIREKANSFVSSRYKGLERRAKVAGIDVGVSMEDLMNEMIDENITVAEGAKQGAKPPGAGGPPATYTDKQGNVWRLQPDGKTYSR